MLTPEVLAVSYMNEGDKAPTTGYFFTESEELQIRTDLTFKTIYVGQLEKKSQLQEDLLKVVKSRADEAEQRLNVKESADFYKNAGFFLAGALVTTVITYGVSKAINSR